MTSYDQVIEASTSISRRHFLDPTKTIDDHAVVIAFDLANNIATKVPRYTATTLEIINL